MGKLRAVVQFILVFANQCLLFRTEGAKRIIPGAITASLVCSALHLALNELGLLRLLILARKDYKIQWSDFFPSINMDAGGWSPVRRIPDEEYRSRLQNKILGYDQKMQQIDKEIEQLKLEQGKAV